MEKIIVTAGNKYTDIDILACAIALSELLQKTGHTCSTVISPVLNKSITDEIKSWDLKYHTKYKSSNDSFIIVDTSHPKFLANFVKENKIIKLYDHHTGYEDYWKEKVGNNAIIEKIGACATLIWEEYRKTSKPLKISQTSANLLSAAIISNTLFFKAKITTPRDKKAYKELQRFSNLSAKWIEKYFMDQEKAVFKNPKQEIINETNIEDFPNSKEKLIIGQIELWDSRKFIEGHKVDIEETLTGFKNPNWFLTSPSISEGKNYLFTKNPEIKELLENLIGAKFVGDIGTTSKLWLRKEIIKELQSKNYGY